MIHLVARLENNHILNYCPLIGWGNEPVRSIEPNDVQEAYDELISVDKAFKPVKALEIRVNNQIIHSYQFKTLSDEKNK